MRKMLSFLKLLGATLVVDIASQLLLRLVGFGLFVGLVILALEYDWVHDHFSLVFFTVCLLVAGIVAWLLYRRIKRKKQIGGDNL